MGVQLPVRVYRSSDLNAPVLGGWAGSLADVLDACLVDGFGSAFASASLTSNGTNVSNGDTVTVGGVTYTFKTAITAAAYDVLIGATAAASLANLAAAIGLFGASGTAYAAATLVNPDAYVANTTSTVLSLQARKGGSGGNAIALSKSAATLTVSGATFSGGSGTNSTVPAGWARPFVGSLPGQRVYQSPSGIQVCVHVDDHQPTAAQLGREAQLRCSLTASGFQAGTGFFPTSAQFAFGSGLWVRKSASADTVVRAWYVVATERTVHLFVINGDNGVLRSTTSFGEFLSLSPTSDSLRAFLISRYQTGSVATTETAPICVGLADGFVNSAGHYLAGPVVGGTSQQCCVRNAPSTFSPPSGAGADTVTGKYYFAPCYFSESSTALFRGVWPGVYACFHSISTFSDGQTISGSGPYLGRDFIALRVSAGSAQQMYLDITGPWDYN